MRAEIFTRAQVAEQFDAGDWQFHAFKELEATFTSSARDFPCIFGVAGFKADELRFAFSESMDATEVAVALESYLKDARSFGKNTSLVVFSRPGPVATVEMYRSDFWDLLSDVSRFDPQPWPKDIPVTINHPQWEWCFAGEPIFVVCNTPAHVNRQSRRSSSFMLTFQPRWVFDGILGTTEKAAAAVAKVRSNLKRYDLITASPDLGLYGTPANREFAQYFLDDANEPASCPFHSIASHEPPKEKADAA